MKGKFVVATNLFLRLLAVVYAIAFISFWTQADGLIGARGILPAGELLELVRARLGGSAYLQLPTLLWLHPTDGFLHLLFGAGTLLSLAAAVVPFSALLWFLLWVLYLSLTVAGQRFLEFQWDVLLLETGFLAIFLAPPRLLPARRWTAGPAPVTLWLYRWLLFRFMFASGVVKLLNDAVWRDLSALGFHYETQCLPPWTAWYVHWLPPWFHAESTAGMFFVELVVPFFVFGPRAARVPAALLLILLQCVISLTGNYCYFNLLSICLCLLLFDDGVWPRRLRGWLGPPEGPPAAEREPAPRRLFRPWPWWFLGPVAAFLLPLSALALASSYEGTARRPQFLAKVYEAVAPFRSINSYGLFRNMTTSRPEIVVEGSDDGKVWKAYEFRHKPGDLARQPRFVAPHQPRLDWQMWFAALGSRSERYWFAMFCLRLLEGSPPVLSLLAENPFPAAPPRQVRAMLYDYRFTTPAERRATGNWWKRESLVVFQRPATLEMMQALFKR